MYWLRSVAGRIVRGRRAVRAGGLVHGGVVAWAVELS